MARPLTVAWFSFFPIEWLDDVPAEVKRLPRLHPATWQRVLLNQLEKNPDIRLHVVVLRKHFERNFTFERRGVTFHCIKTPGGLRAPSLFWVDTLLIKRALKEISPDVVHAWGTENGAALVASRLGYPYLVTIQGLLSWYKEVVPVGHHDRFAAWLERISLPRARLITTESTFAVNYLRRHFPRAIIEQVEHAPDPIFHQVERKPKIGPARFIFLGGFDYRKGVDVLLHALDRLKDESEFELLIVGAPRGRMFDSLKKLVSAELWRRVTFKENLTSQQIAEEFSEATMMIYPTRADVSPNSVKEAVVAGVPVIASAVGGITDYVFPGENGFLFAADNQAACEDALRRACRDPLFSSGRVRLEALRRSRQYLSAELMGKKFAKLYQQVRQDATRS